MAVPSLRHMAYSDSWAHQEEGPPKIPFFHQNPEVWFHAVYIPQDTPSGPSRCPAGLQTSHGRTEEMAEEAYQAIPVLFVFISNPSECIGDGTKICLGKQNHLGSLVRVLNSVQRRKENVLTSDKWEDGYLA